MKYRKIRNKIINRLKKTGMPEKSLNIEYNQLRKLFDGLFTKESPKKNIEEQERLVLSQALLIMKRIYYDPEVQEVFERKMGNPLREIGKTSDFFDFIGKILHG